MFLWIFLKQKALSEIPVNWKIFHFLTFSRIREIYSSGPVSVPIFRPNGESGNCSTKIRWIGTFAKGGNSSKIWSIGIFVVKEDFPANRKIFHFPTFSKKEGNFSYKIIYWNICRWRISDKSDNFPIFLLFNKNMGKKSGGYKKVGVKKKWG